MRGSMKLPGSPKTSYSDVPRPRSRALSAQDSPRSSRLTAHGKSRAPSRREEKTSTRASSSAGASALYWAAVGTLNWSQRRSVAWRCEVAVQWGSVGASRSTGRAGGQGGRQMRGWQVGRGSVEPPTAAGKHLDRILAAPTLHVGRRSGGGACFT